MWRLRNLELMVLVVCLTASTAAGQGVRWRSDVEAAKREAAQTGRLVLLHFGGPGCKPCKVLETTVLNQPHVANAIEQHFVPIKLDTARDSAAAQQYKVVTIPVDVVITPGGQEIGRGTGLLPAQKYLERLNGIAASAGRKPAAQPGVAQASQIAATPAGPAAGIPAGTSSPYAASPTASRVAQQYSPNTPTSGPPGAGTLGRGPWNGAQSGAHNPWQSGPPPGTPALPPADPRLAHPPANPTRPDPYRTNAPPPSGSGIVPYGAPHHEPNNPYGPPPQLANNSPYGPPPGASPNTAPPGAPPVGIGAPQQPAPPQPGLPPLGFEGYCIVTMHQHLAWAKGDPRWGVIHEDRLYLFASPLAKDQFLGDPQRYAPVLSGYDVVLLMDTGQPVPGQRRFGATYQAPGENGPRIYLFANEGTVRKFEANPVPYVERVRQAQNRPLGQFPRK